MFITTCSIAPALLYCPVHPADVFYKCSEIDTLNKVAIRAYFLENVWKPMATIYLVSLRVVTEGSKFKGHETYILRGDGD